TASGCAIGQPQKPIAASPWKSAMTPPSLKMLSVMTPRALLTRVSKASKSSACCSQVREKPRMSQKRTVTVDSVSFRAASGSSPPRVGRLEIAVQHAAVVRVHQAGRDLAKDRDRSLHWQRSLQLFVERSIFQVLHHEIGRVRVPADFEKLNDVGIV